MKTDRPVYLSLTQFRWPFPAIASITHRATGVLLFVGVAYLLWLLDMALTSEAGFNAAARVVQGLWGKLLLIAVIAVLLYHLLAGVKHLFMDFHIGETITAAKVNSAAVFVLTALGTVLVGAWLW